MKRTGIKIVSVNIEMNRHIEAVSSFLKREQPDVVCFQELLERDVPYFETLLGMTGKFVPTATLACPGFDAEVMGKPFGVAMFSRFEMTYDVAYYSGEPSSLPRCVEGREGYKLLLRGTFSENGKDFPLGVTHFTWTPDGVADDAQRSDINAFLSVAAQSPEIILCGDFNAPRGREIWGKIAERYHDNIPLSYDSSIDPHLHRAGHLRYVVDGLFSTGGYLVSDVRLVEGVSDHKAIVGFIERV